ncbi:hypothetical protein BJX96DRAFT_155906, partial [Aspergillus floccosus]
MASMFWRIGLCWLISFLSLFHASSGGKMRAGLFNLLYCIWHPWLVWGHPSQFYCGYVPPLYSGFERLHFLYFWDLI